MPRPSLAASLAVFAALGLTIPSDVSAAPPEKAPAKKGGKKKKKPDGIGPFTKKNYPIEAAKRPLVLPNGMGEAGLDAGYLRFAGVDVVTTAPSFSYGVADVVDFGVSSTLLLSPDVDWGRDLNLEGHYLLVDTKELDWAPGLRLPLVLADGAGFGVVIDLPGRYVLNDLVFFTFGRDAVPLTFAPDFGLQIAANGGVGFQVDPSLALTLETNPLTLVLAPDATATGIWDYLNLQAGGQYSPTKFWDAGLRMGLITLWGVDNSTFVTASLYGRYRF